MCLFSGPVRQVSETSIFARATAGGRQVLAYAMTVAADVEVAMVLPIPVPPSSPDDAVRFVDLSGYPDLFAHLRAGFPSPQRLGGQTMKFALSVEKPLLVHDVGAFEASFVPALADFARLDERFRPPPGTWDALPAYRDFGFAVFKLKDLRAGAAITLHPMALDFPRRDQSRLFFPTVHVHDGTVHPTATFDHELYAQADRLGPDDGAWLRSPEPARAFVRGDSRGVVAPAQHCFRLRLRGDGPNRDTLLAVG